MGTPVKHHARAQVHLLVRISSSELLILSVEILSSVLHIFPNVLQQCLQRTNLDMLVLIHMSKHISLLARFHVPCSTPAIFFKKWVGQCTQLKTQGSCLIQRKHRQQTLLKCVQSPASEDEVSHQNERRASSSVLQAPSRPVHGVLLSLDWQCQ